MSANMLKEYFVSLGLKDNFSGKLNSTLGKSSTQVKQFAKGFAVAGGAVGTLLATANTGVAKFLVKLVAANDEVKKFAKETGKSEAEAFKLKATLDAMGKTMAEIEANPELLRTFKQLQKDAEAVKAPDMTEGLNQVREIQTEFTRLKQSATYALQWVGHYLLKYIQQPLQKVKEIFSGFNDMVIKNIPNWSKKAASFMGAFVRLGAAIIRLAADIFKAVKRIFDLIPIEIKGIGAALTALALFVRAGPIGKLVMILSAALLLLDDFLVYLEGGDALLGNVWQKLIDIWQIFKDSGAIERFKEGFISALAFISQKIDEAKSYCMELFDMFKESGSVQKFIGLVKQLWELFVELVRPVGDVGKVIADMLSTDGKTVLEWFIRTGLPSLLDFLKAIAEMATNVMSTLNKFGVTETVIKGLLASFLGFKAVKGTISTLDGFAKSVKLANSSLKSMATGINKAGESFHQLGKIGKLKSELGGLASSFIGLLKAVRAFTIAKIKDIAVTIQLTAMYAKDFVTAVAKGTVELTKQAARWVINTGLKIADTAAQIAMTAATVAWNVVAGIAATVTTAFGATIAFLTSPIGLVILAVVALIAIVALLIKNWDKVKTFFIGLWNNIKETFSGAGEWFKEKFTQAKEAVILAFNNIDEWFREKWNAVKEVFSNSDSFFGQIAATWMRGIEAAFSTIVDYFATLWGNIKLIFSAVKSVLSGDFKGAYEAIVQIWENIIGFFLRTIERIKEVFVPIVNWFRDKAADIVDKFANIPQDLRDKFLEAVNKIKEVFSPLVNWFKEKIEAIKGFFSSIGDKIKGAYNTTPDKPPTNGYADGGIVDKEQTARVAEGNKPEAIIPLSKPNRAKELLSGAMNYLGMDTPEKISAKADALTQFAGKASEMLNALNTGLNQNTSYLYTTNYQTTDNRSYDMRSSFTIHDSSGRPEAVANAVDRTKQMQLRNLQGILGS